MTGDVFAPERDCGAPGDRRVRFVAPNICTFSERADTGIVALPEGEFRVSVLNGLRLTYDVPHPCRSIPTRAIRQDAGGADHELLVRTYTRSVQSGEETAAELPTCLFVRVGVDAA